MATTLVMALRETRTARDTGVTALTDEQLSFLRSCYAGAIKQMREDNHPATTPLYERGLSLAQRFGTHRDMILRFVDNLAVPFTNNVAEREVRPVKVKQRSGGCWRTLTGLADLPSSGPTCPPPPNMAWTTSTSSPNFSPPDPGSHPNQHQPDPY